MTRQASYTWLRRLLHAVRCADRPAAWHPQVVVLVLEGLEVSLPPSSMPIGMPLRERSILRLPPAACCAVAAPAVHMHTEEPVAAVQW